MIAGEHSSRADVLLATSRVGIHGMPSVAKSGSAIANKLLALLPPSQLAELSRRLELVPLVPGAVLSQRGRIGHVYFPLSGLVTKVVTMADGKQIEAGMVGNEGMIPLCLFMGLDASPFEAEVQNAGEALQMTARAFQAAIRPGDLFHGILLKFAAAFLSQVSLSAACKHLHPLRMQFCRYLLMTHDRLENREFTLTQAAIAHMLGVRRMSVVGVARQLQEEGVIEYRRARIQILDLAGLKRLSCECYSREREVYRNLFAPGTPRMPDKGSRRG